MAQKFGDKVLTNSPHMEFDMQTFDKFGVVFIGKVLQRKSLKAVILTNCWAFVKNFKIFPRQIFYAIRYAFINFCMHASIINILSSGDFKSRGQREVSRCSNYPINVTIIN